MRMIYVEWYDPTSETDNSWTPVSACVGHLAVCRSLGFLIKETELTITVAGHVDDDGSDFSGEINIPKACIISIRDILITK